MEQEEEELGVKKDWGKYEEEEEEDEERGGQRRE